MGSEKLISPLSAKNPARILTGRIFNSGSQRLEVFSIASFSKLRKACRMMHSGLQKEGLARTRAVSDMLARPFSRRRKIAEGEWCKADQRGGGWQPGQSRCPLRLVHLEEQHTTFVSGSSSARGEDEAWGSDN